MIFVLTQSNNSAAPERSQVIGEMQKLSASGERNRYLACIVGCGSGLEVIC
jgi:hypothetical protein